MLWYWCYVWMKFGQGWIPLKLQFLRMLVSGRRHHERVDLELRIALHCAVYKLMELGIKLRIQGGIGTE